MIDSAREIVQHKAGGVGEFGFFGDDGRQVLVRAAGAGNHGTGASGQTGEPIDLAPQKRVEGRA